MVYDFLKRIKTDGSISCSSSYKVANCQLKYFLEYF